MWYLFLVGKKRKGRRKRRGGWAAVDQLTSSNFQINSGIKIPNTR